MGKTTTEMQLVAVSKLITYVNNARTHSAEQVMKLRSSLREFGFINLIIIDREFNVIVGHGRILAAKEEGILEVPCVFVDYLTEAQKKAYILADNRMAMDAGWDEELLRIEIADLFGSDDTSGVKDDDYDLSAALEKVALVKRGDIWTVGRHRLMCGDATSSEDVAALMDGKKANLIVTDPPYNVAFGTSINQRRTRIIQLPSHLICLLILSEIEPFPIRVTTKRLPQMKHYGDISKMNGGNPSCNQGGMAVIEGNGTRPSHKGDGYKESDVMYTLNATEQH